MMDDAVAYFFTIVTYGTWLPGDERGWIEFKHGWQLPNAIKELESYAKMNEDICYLSVDQRRIVEAQIAETCSFRNWQLLACNCRSNHVHFVVGASHVTPKKIRQDIKAWCTRRLKEHSPTDRENWWTERGSIRWIFKEEDLEQVILYVTEAQDRKGRELLSQLDASAGKQQ